MMLVNPLVADAMKRAGEQVPATGIIAMSNGTPIACALNPGAEWPGLGGAKSPLNQAKRLLDQAVTLLNKAAQSTKAADSADPYHSTHFIEQAAANAFDAKATVEEVLSHDR